MYPYKTRIEPGLSVADKNRQQRPRGLWSENTWLEERPKLEMIRVGVYLSLRRTSQKSFSWKKSSWQLGFSPLTGVKK
jgi:hypothetical protein